MLGTLDPRVEQSLLKQWRDRDHDRLRSFALGVERRVDEPVAFRLPATLLVLGDKLQIAKARLINVNEVIALLDQGGESSAKDCSLDVKLSSVLPLFVKSRKEPLTERNFVALVDVAQTPFTHADSKHLLDILHPSLERRCLP